MSNDMNKKLEQLLSSVDKSKLQKGTQNIAQLLNSSEGQKLKARLAGMDKQKLINTISKMDAQQIKSALENADTSKLGGMSADDIIDKLKKL